MNERVLARWKADFVREGAQVGFSPGQTEFLWDWIEDLLTLAREVKRG